MSWYSDGEPFDERDPDYCERIKCDRPTGKDYCDRCMERLKERLESEDEND